MQQSRAVENRVTVNEESTAGTQRANHPPSYWKNLKEPDVQRQRNRQAKSVLHRPSVLISAEPPEEAHHAATNANWAIGPRIDPATSEHAPCQKASDDHRD